MKIRTIFFIHVRGLLFLLVLCNASCLSGEDTDKSSDFEMTYKLVSEVYMGDDIEIAEKILKKFEGELSKGVYDSSQYLGASKEEYQLETWFRLWKIYSFKSDGEQQSAYADKITKKLSSIDTKYADLESLAVKYERDRVPGWKRSSKTLKKKSR